MTSSTGLNQDVPPTISVIVPVRRGTYPDRVLEGLAGVDYPHDRIEVILVEGTNPSDQRNAGAALASGDILYFLDDDSFPDVDLFRYGIRTIDAYGATIVGGPSEFDASGTLLQRCIGYVLSSYFATANVRCRYRPVGRFPKEGTEQNLILCNLAVMREAFQLDGGFEASLYPNEENEFLSRMLSKGYLAIYNPKMVVNRPHRNSFSQFVKQMITYGRGRMDHFLFRPSSFNPIYLLPLAFLAYLGSLPVVIAAAFTNVALLAYLIPLALYLQGVAVTTLRILAEERDWGSAIVAPILFPVVHVCYASGLIWGVAQPIARWIHSSKSLDSAHERIRYQSSGLEAWRVKPFGAFSFPENFVSALAVRIEEPIEEPISEGSLEASKAAESLSV